MMEQQLQKKKDEITGVKLMKVKVDALLGNLGDVAVERERTKPDISSKELVKRAAVSRERQRDAWRALQAMEV